MTYHLLLITYHQRKICLLVIIGWLSVNLSGCATVIEGAKSFMGISTQALEQARKDALAKSFPYDYFTSFTKAHDALKEIKAYIYKQNIKKRMIAIYVSEQDTTPVGIFFREIDPNTTQVEVSSPSTFAKEIIAKRLFALLQGLPDPEARLLLEEEKEP